MSRDAGELLRFLGRPELRRLWTEARGRLEHLGGPRGTVLLAGATDAERQVQRYAKEHPNVEVAILRFAPILGPTVSNMYTRFFSRPVAPVMMGHDPLMQFVHEQDAAYALQKAVDSHATGAFNIVGKGVLPYTTVLALLGRVPVPMPQLVARQLTKVLWATQLVGSPPSFLDFLLYLCVADGGKARENYPSARRGPLLDLSWGWEPHWTFASNPGGE